MPRTIESIMAAHNEVNRRRAALLPHWALKIELVQPGPKDAIYTDLPRNQLESAAASYSNNHYRSHRNASFCFESACHDFQNQILYKAMSYRH
jgi:hypothetical protein